MNYAANRSKLLALDIPNNPTIDRYILGTERRRGTVFYSRYCRTAFICFNRHRLHLFKRRKSNDGKRIACRISQRQGNRQYPTRFCRRSYQQLHTKGFTLSGLIDFQEGGNFFSYTNMYGLGSGTLAETVANNIRETGVDVRVYCRMEQKLCM